MARVIDGCTVALDFRVTDPGLFGTKGVKNPGKLKVRLCRTGVAAPGFVIATCLEVDGFPRVYHTTIRLI